MHPVEEQLCRAWAPQRWADVTVLAAVSGGPDSVAMLRAMTAVRRPGPGRIVVAHLNHGLRGRESEADAAFVAELCRQMDVECRIAAVDVRRQVRGGEGLEAAARRARYQFLAATAATVGARYVVTAHTADDQVETILHRIIRGTGIGGLAGMPQARPLMLPLVTPQPAESTQSDLTCSPLPDPKETAAWDQQATDCDDWPDGLFGDLREQAAHPSATLIRPLLAVWRRQIIEYLAWLQQPYRQDQTNLELNYARNKIRQKLLPWLAADFHPAVAQSLLRLGKLAGEVQAVVEPIVEKLFSQAVRVDDCRRASIDRCALLAQPRYLVREVLIAVWRAQRWPMQAMGFEQWDALADMLLAGPSAATPSSRTFPGNVQAEVAADQLRLERLADR